MTVRSATVLGSKARQDMQELTPNQIRSWQPPGRRSEAVPQLVDSHRQKLMNDMADFVETAQGMLTDYGKLQVKGLAAERFHMPRDMDGNEIYLDGDKPYILGPDSEKILVKVFKVSVPPSEVGKFGGVCTPENPDGKVEGLVVERLPTIEAQD